MFIEPHQGSKSGWIEVICGSMFSGKTEELLRRIRRAKIANQRIEIFKPKIDTRYAEEDVVSHDTNKVRSTPVSHSNEILLLADDAAVVGIDEVQFLDEGIVSVATELAAQGRRVIIAGLDMDFQGRPFGPMGALLAVADYITKLHAICMQCGGMATFSYRKVSGDAKVLLGEQESYEPRCRSCYNQ